MLTEPLARGDEALGAGAECQVQDAVPALWEQAAAGAALVEPVAGAGDLVLVFAEPEMHRAVTGAWSTSHVSHASFTCIVQASTHALPASAFSDVRERDASHEQWQPTHFG